jgi:16S rRNA (cytosine1402-N4)-methyltransferase
VLPHKVKNQKGHPAKQVFQALRIEVNDEINVLKKALLDASKLLASNGRIVVISFHSGEDRIVKNFFKSLAVIEGDRINGPTIKKESEFNLITTKPMIASENELSLNNRSHSAKLRILEKK